MKIFIKANGSFSFVLEVNLTDTINDIKNQIQQMFGIPIVQQCLIYHNRITKNWLKLQDYSVENHSTFNLVLFGDINMNIKNDETLEYSENNSFKKEESRQEDTEEPVVKMETVQPIIQRSIICKACDKPIDEEPIFISEYPYHLTCIKCMKCGCSCQNIGNRHNFTCVTPGLFLCKNDLNQYETSRQLTTENYQEYHKKNVKNFVNQFFNESLQNEVYEESQSEYSLLSPEVIEDSIQKDIPYENLIPTVTFKFDKSPDQIDFEKLKEILGDDVLIVNVEKGCTFLKIAFRSIKKFIGNCNEKIENCVKKVKDVITTVGKAVIGNIVDEPIIKVPKDDEIQALYNKSSKNLLQNTYELNEIQIEDIKKEVFSKLENENDKKNWNHLFSHEQIFKEAENKIRDDVLINEFEIVLIAQTMIANRHLDELLTREKNDHLKHFYVYHGTKLGCHQSIVKNDFLMPGKDTLTHSTDDGWYGKGIYATDNMIYSAFYSSGYHLLSKNEKAHIICCIAIYNESNTINIESKSQYQGKPISVKVAQSSGMHKILVGSLNGFEPIKESNKDNNYISAREFVFPNKYQIIPIYSFTIMRKEHFILWKDDDIRNSENAEYMKDLQKEMEVNVYGVDSVSKAVEIIQRKKRNKIKLMTNAGKSLTGKKLIEEARKIIGSNFVCLVFARSHGHLEWIKDMENVLFTTSSDDFRRFAKLDMNKTEILNFAHDLEKEYDCKFKINENELLNFQASHLYQNDQFYSP